MRQAWRPGVLLLLLALLVCDWCSGTLLLPGTAEPRWYKLELLPHVTEGRFTGRVRINITCLEHTDTLVLHADPSLLVTTCDVSVCHPSSRSTWSEQVSVVDVQRDARQQLLILVLSSRLNRHSCYSISLEFEGKLGAEGGYGLIRRTYFDEDTNNTGWYAVTNMKIDTARLLFPCFDESSYKATFEISVGTPSHQHVFSNLPLADIENVEGRPGWYWKHFTLSPLMSAFSVGIVVLEYDHFSLAEGSFHIVGSTAIENKIETTITYLQDVYEYLQDYMDFPYPLLKLDIVFVPGVYREESSSWGLIVLGEDSVTNMDRSYLARRMATQWVVHWTTPRWQSVWATSAGLAMHLGYQFLDKSNVMFTWDRVNLHCGTEDASFDEEGKSKTDRRIERVFRLLGLLQDSLTKKTFQSGFHKFFKSRKYKTFTEADLWQAVTSQAHKDITLPHDVTVEDVVESWLVTTLFPVLTVTRDYSHKTFTVTQRAFQPDKLLRLPQKDDTLWYVPIVYMTPNNMNISATQARYWMKKQREITVDKEQCPDKFIIVNPAETGSMMVVNYDQTNWALIADALQRKLLSTAVRGKLLHDAWNLAFSGELNFNSAMNMTLFLKDETECTVWDTMDEIFYRVWSYLDGTRAGAKFKRYLSALTRRSGCTPSLLKDYVRPVLRHNNWSSEEPPMFDLDDLCNTLKTADVADFQRVLKNISKLFSSRGEKYQQDVVNSFLTCVRESVKIHRILELVMSKENDLLPDELLRQLLTGVSRFNNGYTTLFLFIRQNFATLSQHFERKPELWQFVVRTATASFSTEEGLEMVLQLYRDRRYELGAAEAVVRESLDQINANIRWSKKNVPVMEHWLNKYFYEQELKQQHL